MCKQFFIMFFNLYAHYVAVKRHIFEKRTVYYLNVCISIKINWKFCILIISVNAKNAFISTWIYFRFINDHYILKIHVYWKWQDWQSYLSLVNLWDLWSQECTDDVRFLSAAEMLNALPHDLMAAVYWRNSCPHQTWVINKIQTELNNLLIFTTNNSECS